MQTALPDTVPPHKCECLRSAVAALAALEGVVAVVLGGSYARGTYQANSDLDLGVYYSESAPFSVAEIRRVATELCTGAPPVVTEFYEWGPWVNGGAWIHTDVGKVDFLYRNVEQIERTIQDARRGLHQRHYDQQPTFGFYSVTYLAETHVCVPLFDPRATIARLKREVAVYPPKLKQALVADSLWAAEFAFLFAHKFATAGDVYNTAGCLSRISGYMTQALYALNETYFVSDKGALDAVRQFIICPAEYVQRLTQVLAHPGETAEQLVKASRQLEALWQEVVRLAGASYRPKYPLR
ncbi:MAG TPA: nucleotidyltransferase domain-containing protein [Candidatus Binatia bacterium]|nr:nucleotidyltransferase domain-containing protein [Candidatus Binatia bacterium]